MGGIGHVVTAAVKPKLRGWLHQGGFVVSLVSGPVIVALASTAAARAAAVVYAVSQSLLFGTSALYHRRTWNPRARAVMKRLDHSMILVLIAGTWTPFAVVVLGGAGGLVVAALVWTGALVGIAVRMFWLRAPRWAVIPPYLVVGWSAVLALPAFAREAGVASLVLIVLGGLLYTAGAVIYAVRQPDPWPAVFGYHEVFHLLTIVAGILLYVAAAVAVSRA